jgi:hypothetical protein
MAVQLSYQSIELTVLDQEALSPFGPYLVFIPLVMESIE